MLGRRFLTVLLALPLFLAALYAGGWLWVAFLLVCGAIGTWESARLLHVHQLSVFIPALIGASLLIGLAHFTGGMAGLPAALGLLIILLSLWLMHFEVGRKKERSAPSVLTVIAAAVYPGLFLSLFVTLRDMGFHFFLLAAFVTWLTDTGAYFVGRSFGKKPLWPAVSPNKTMEGALGGLFLGTLTGLIFGYVMGESSLLFGAIALGTSILAQIGDLYESALKRKSGVKDSGTLLPGHGGILDRLDSLFFAVSGVVVMLNWAGMV